MTTVAIMQPTYLPWIGYFDLIDQSDIFVFLDSVQFDKRSWQQRNRIKSVNGELMLTVPVLSKGKRDQKLRDVQIDSSQKYSSKHLRTISNNYCKSKYFREYQTEFSNLYSLEYKYLADLNITLIKWLTKKLGMQVEFIRSSSLEASGKKVLLLVNICKKLGAHHYLSPYGSKTYIEENNLFLKNDIKLSYQDFRHPKYRQLWGEFIPYLSIIDLVFNEGKRSLDIIREGRG